MGPYVPAGQSPPFEVVDDMHHGAWVIITAAMGLVVSLACFLIRLYVRLMLIPPFARDDWVLLGATYFNRCKEYRRGAIKSHFLCVLAWIRDFYIVIEGWSTRSDSGLAIYLRLTPQKPHNRASWATLALCTAWIIPAIFIVLVNCELNTPWRSDSSQCNNLYIRWQFIAAVDVITELLLFLLAVILLKGLFMSVRRKLTVGLAFIFRFPLIIFSLVHISTLHTALNSQDTTLAAVKPTVWMQVELHYALVACSVFCLRPFMAAVSTNYGTAGDSTLESSASRSRSNGTKEDSKTGSGSNSNIASRSMSHSRRNRKRAGTGPWPPLSYPPVSGSGSGPGAISSPSENQAPMLDPTLRLDTSPHAHGALRNDQMDRDSGKSDTVRAPTRRSMFPLSAPRKKHSSQKMEKGKHGVRAGSVGPFAMASDLIELVPRPHIRHASGMSERGAGEEADKMVIHKEVRYSIQYEDEAEIRRREDLTINSVDVSAYV
ncbi:hypothetical protein PENVUL_c048G04598 [Penicillium vulpinum]|uniref:Rhodopsin domain-containing protein n=1 Tax=Penicillium vulpinum TaxID=29845 RepID=A0A1V6RG99_9EURO|nr:hypothetical protein PENVUL_c048G04598 [Penicillium vulpinum]